MAPFSSDQGVKPPTRFAPSQAGAKAAEKALKPPKGQGQSRTATPSPSGRPGASQRPQLGHPDFSQATRRQDQAPSLDNRHLDLVGSWVNMKGLGRDVPWGVWAGLSGSYRQLAKPGQPPFDLFEEL